MLQGLNRESESPLNEIKLIISLIGSKNPYFLVLTVDNIGGGKECRLIKVQLSYSYPFFTHYIGQLYV